jgi:hypothetical protein
MSNGLFLLALTAGAALLAMWLHARVPSLAPERIGLLIVNAAAAFVLLKLTAAFGAGSTTAFATVLLLVLPALTYALLCTIWVLKHAQAALGVSR